MLDVGGTGRIRVGEAGGRLEPLVGHQRDDLLVVLPLESPDTIRVPDDEDPQLRAAMDERLLELCDDDDLVGPATRVAELRGSPQKRLTGLLTALGGR